jgi:hypothetical protein
LRALRRRLRIAFLPVPGQALGLAVLVVVLAAAVVSAPLMIASAEQAAWEQQQDRLPPSALGTTVLSGTYTGDGRPPTRRVGLVADLDEAISAAVVDSGFEAPELLTQLRFPALAATARGPQELDVVHRTGGAEHLELVAGEVSDDGVLIPEELATATGVEPGGTLAITSRTGAPARLAVSGVYVKPLEPLPAFWEPTAYFFVPRYDPAALDLVPPPPVVFAPRETALAAYEALREDVYVTWSVPLGDGTGIAAARQAAADTAELQLRLADPGSPAADLVSRENFADLLTRSALPDALTDVDRTTTLLTPPVRAVGVGGGVAALVLVGAWASLRVRRRDDELRSLTARGLSPARAAAHAVRESLLPVVVGLAIGGAAGWLLVRALGPSERLPVGVLAPAGWSLLAAGVVVRALVGTVTALQVTRMDQVGRARGGVLRRIPWLGLTAVAAVLTAVPLLTGAVDAEPGRIGVLPLLLPLLVTVVAAGVVTAVLPWLGRVTGSRARRLAPPAYLAARRVVAGAGAARLVVVSTALSLGLLLFAGALAASTDRTVAAKASVATGSDVVVPIARTSPHGSELPDDAMLVGVENSPVLVPGETLVDLVLVHPEQVPHVVRWDGSFAGQPLEELMAGLGDYRGDRVPVIVAGSLPTGAIEATDGEFVLDFTDYSIPVEVVGRADAFPGQNSREPLIVGDWDRYADALTAVSRVPELVVTRQVWARGAPDDVVDEVVAADLAPRDIAEVTSAADFAARPELDAQTWALGYLRAVALAGGVLGLVGVLLHAMSQQRRRTAAALLLTRMGMTRRAADASTALEIGLLTWADLALVVGGLVLVTAGGAALVGRAARRESGGQVLRESD